MRRARLAGIGDQTDFAAGRAATPRRIRSFGDLAKPVQSKLLRNVLKRGTRAILVRARESRELFMGLGRR